MSAAELLQELHREKISITIVNGSLKCKASKPIPPELVSRIKQGKPEIIRLIQNKESASSRRVVKELQTCPLCNGSNFIHGDNGGYFCASCQPGIAGRRVKAGTKRGDR